MKNSTNIPIGQLHPFQGHPYQVRDDAEMVALVESIREHGILTPLIVRPLENQPNEYEVISGHRRLHAAQKAGIHEVPAFVHAISREEAAIQLVDSNLHREHILPSEKAFAYKLKMDAMKRQGKRTDLTSSQVATKFDAAAEIGSAAKESRDTVYRYIRLTNLIPALLSLMDEGRIAFSVGVELSYLLKAEQEAVLKAIEFNDCTPSYSQACRMRKESEMFYAGDTPKIVASILSEPKPNQREQIRLRRDRFQQYFPAGYTDKQIENGLAQKAAQPRSWRAMRGGDSMNQPALNIAPMDFCGEDSFEMKIGSTTYEVHTHFNIEGKQSVLEQFRTLILKEKLI